MPAWTLHLIASAGFVALLGRLPYSGSLVEALLIAAAICGTVMVGLYGKKAIRAAASRIRAHRTSQPSPSTPSLRGAHV